MRTIEVKVIDLIDLYLSAIQLGQGGEEIAEFLLDFFPTDTNDSDFTDYWEHYKLLLESQRAALEDLALELKKRLIEEDKWGEDHR